MEYLENEKSFFNEIKNIFYSCRRAIIWWKNKNLIKNTRDKLYGKNISLRKYIKHQKILHWKKNTSSKRKSGSLWDFLQQSFQCGISHWCPMGSTNRDTHSGIANLYPKHFNQSHSCMHIKEGCITAYVNYGSYWMCQIIMLD